MTPAEVLDRVLEAGGQIVADRENPRLLLPARPGLKPLVLEHRGALRLLVHYRAALLALWGAATDGASPVGLWPMLDDVVRLIDEVGEPSATRLRHRWAREYHAQSGVCPLCMTVGPYHDPDDARP